MENKMAKEFRVEIGTRFQDEKRDITITERRRNTDAKGRIRKYYKYFCNKCSFSSGKHYSIKNKQHKEELWIEESNLLSGNGCSCCCNPSQIIVIGINDISTVTPWMTKYLKSPEDATTHLSNSSKKVSMICPDCGDEKKISMNNLFRQGFSCSKCGDGFSYPNKFMYNMLRQLGIEFETEYTPDWIKPRRYDFYIPDKKIIIEMDGGWHNQNNNLNGQTVEETRKIDSHKDLLAEERGIKLIRINSNKSDLEHIKNNILNSCLKSYFNMEKIDFNECDFFSKNINIVAMVCEFWNKNNSLSTFQMAEILKMKRETIISYLNQGTRNNLCNYDIKKIQSKNGKLRSKSVICLETLEIFESSIFIENVSLSKFGVKMGHRSISNCCTGKQKTSYKGYNFRFYDDKENKILWLENDMKEGDYYC